MPSMLPLLLRDLFIGNSSSLDAGAAAAGAAFGGGGGNRTGGPPASTLPAAERAGTAGGATVTGSAGFAAAAGGAGAAARAGDGAGAPSHTDASAPSAEPECRRRRAATSELASASLCERSKHGASLRAMSRRGSGLRGRHAGRTHLLRTRRSSSTGETYCAKCRRCFLTCTAFDYTRFMR